MKRIVVVMAAVGMLGGGIANAGGGEGCHTPTTSSATGNRVKIDASCISPTVLNVDPGSRVEWVSQDSYPHTITSGTGAWQEAEVFAGDNFAHTFETAGAYPWYCRYHLNMGGIVSVGDVTAPPAPQTETRSGLGVVPSAGIATALAGSMGFVAGRRRRVQD